MQGVVLIIKRISAIAKKLLIHFPYVGYVKRSNFEIMIGLGY